jgi:hypothetical protein
MAHRDELNTPLIAIVGFLGAIATFAIIVVLQVLYYQLEAAEQLRKEISPAPAELASAIADQEAKLADYRWIDQQKQLVGIPIDRAMRLVVDDLAAGRDPVRYAPVTTAAEAGPGEGPADQGAGQEQPDADQPGSNQPEDEPPNDDQATVEAAADAK